ERRLGLLAGGGGVQVGGAGSFRGASGLLGDRADPLLGLAEAQLPLASDLLARHQLRLCGTALRGGDPLVGFVELAARRGQFALDRGTLADQLLLTRPKLLASRLIGGGPRRGDLAC